MTTLHIESQAGAKTTSGLQAQSARRYFSMMMHMIPATKFSFECCICIIWEFCNISQTGPAQLL